MTSLGSVAMAGIGFLPLRLSSVAPAVTVSRARGATNEGQGGRTNGVLTRARQAMLPILAGILFFFGAAAPADAAEENPQTRGPPPAVRVVGDSGHTADGGQLRARSRMSVEDSSGERHVGCAG